MSNNISTAGLDLSGWTRYYLSSQLGMAGGWNATGLQIKINNNVPVDFPTTDS